LKKLETIFFQPGRFPDWQLVCLSPLCEMMLHLKLKLLDCQLPWKKSARPQKSSARTRSL